jgi:hypothetical protein
VYDPAASSRDGRAPASLARGLRPSGGARNRRHSGRAAALGIATLLLVTACAGTSPSALPTPAAISAAPGEPGGAETPPGESPRPTLEPGEPTGSSEPPGETPTDQPPDPGASPDPEPSVEPAATADPGAPLEPGPAAACSGTDANRDFYAGVADAVSWTLLCPVLGRGWYVESGTYRLASGGRLEISYLGPDGASLELSQGAFCPDTGGCVPDGSDVGAAPLGPLEGTLVALEDGAWAIVVDRGASISWLLVVRGVDEQTARRIGERHVMVDR